MAKWWKRRRRQIEPLPEAVPIWQHPSSRYPDLYRVSFENGQTRTYQLVYERHPAFNAAMEGIKVIIGYQCKWKEPEP